MTDVDTRACDIHRDREAVAGCESCGRGVCVACAVPVRGRVLCPSCAAREVGVPAPRREERPTSRAPDIVATAMLATALLATIPPWDRFGPRTGVFSAWRAAPSPWPPGAGLALLGAGLFAALAARGHGRSRTWWVVVYGALAAAAAALTSWQVFGAPDYVSHTPAPFAVIALATASAAIGFVRLVRSR